MKLRHLGQSGIKVSALGLGCMGLSEGYGIANPEQGRDVIQKAYEAKINFFDTADIYGSGENEKLVGEAIKPFRSSIILASKCGIQRGDRLASVDSSPKYIKEACNQSLSRLGVETIDLYYLHRHNPATPIEEAMQAMQTLIQAGKIRFVGLSEVDAETIQRAHSVLGKHLAAVQSEYSIVNYTQAERVLPICKKLGIAFVAFSPIARGLLSGKITDHKPLHESPAFDFRSILPQFQKEALQQNLGLINALKDFAQMKRCTPAQLSLAWLLAKGEEIIPIPGTKRLDYLNENLGALNVEISPQDLQALNEIIQEHPIHGARLPEELMKALHMKS